MGQNLSILHGIHTLTTCTITGTLFHLPVEQLILNQNDLLMSIERGAFWDLPYLKRLTLNSNQVLINISSQAFVGATQNLKTIEVDDCPMLDPQAKQLLENITSTATSRSLALGAATSSSSTVSSWPAGEGPASENGGSPEARAADQLASGAELASTSGDFGSPLADGAKPSMISERAVGGAQRGQLPKSSAGGQLRAAVHPQQQQQNNNNFSRQRFHQGALQSPGLLNSAPSNGRQPQPDFSAQSWSPMGPLTLTRFLCLAGSCGLLLAALSLVLKYTSTRHYLVEAHRRRRRVYQSPEHQQGGLGGRSLSSADEDERPASNEPQQPTSPGGSRAHSPRLSFRSGSPSGSPAPLESPSSTGPSSASRRPSGEALGCEMFAMHERPHHLLGGRQASVSGEAGELEQDAEAAHRGETVCGPEEAEEALQGGEREEALSGASSCDQLPPNEQYEPHKLDLSCPECRQQACCAADSPREAEGPASPADHALALGCFQPEGQHLEVAGGGSQAGQMVSDGAQAQQMHTDHEQQPQGQPQSDQLEGQQSGPDEQVIGMGAGAEQANGISQEQMEAFHLIRSQLVAAGSDYGHANCAHFYQSIGPALQLADMTANFVNRMDHFY